MAFGRFFEQARFSAHGRIGLGAVLSREGRRLLIGRVTIGNDCFVAAHALVTVDVPASHKVLPRSSFELRKRAGRGDDDPVSR